MFGSKLYFSILISAIIFLLLSTNNSLGKKTSAEVNSSLPDSLLAGKRIYDEYCIACHGVNGKGDGIDANQMKTLPTDFTSGMYKFKSTPFGTLPTVEDIVTTLKSGIRTTAMIPQRQLDNEEMRQVAVYVLAFAPEEEKIGTPIVLPTRPEFNSTLIGEGKKVFDSNCASCHGKNAKGDGPSADKLLNYKGKPIQPANLAEVPLKRANTPDWIYRIINNGIEGTPMPPYFGAIKPKYIWAIVCYIDSIKKEKLTSRNNGGMMGMMGSGMMGHRLVGEENIGARIDMAAAHAWMMKDR